MPLDPYFTRGFKHKARKAEQIAAKHRRGWPEGSQYRAQRQLEMREPGGDWWHFTNVPAETAEQELADWKDANPAHAFRLVPLDKKK